MAKLQNPAVKAVAGPDRAPQIKVPIKALLLAWMGASAFVFVAVSVSPAWPWAAVLPEFVLRTRDWLLPLFIN